MFAHVIWPVEAKYCSVFLAILCYKIPPLWSYGVVEHQPLRWILYASEDGLGVETSGHQIRFYQIPWVAQHTANITYHAEVSRRVKLETASKCAAAPPLWCEKRCRFVRRWCKPAKAYYSSSDIGRPVSCCASLQIRRSDQHAVSVKITRLLSVYIDRCKGSVYNSIFNEKFNGTRISAACVNLKASTCWWRTLNHRW